MTMIRLFAICASQSRNKTAQLYQMSEQHMLMCKMLHKMDYFYRNSGMLQWLHLLLPFQIVLYYCIQNFGLKKKTFLSIFEE